MISHLVSVEPNFKNRSHRVESVRPGSRLQTSLLTAVDPDRWQQQPQRHQNRPAARTMHTHFWRVSCTRIINWLSQFETGSKHSTLLWGGWLRWFYWDPCCSYVQVDGVRTLRNKYGRHISFQAGTLFNLSPNGFSLNKFLFLLFRILSEISPIRGLRAVVRLIEGYHLLEVRQLDDGIPSKAALQNALTDLVSVHSCRCADLGFSRPPKMPQPDRPQHTRQSVWRWWGGCLLLHALQVVAFPQQRES